MFAIRMLKFGPFKRNCEIVILKNVANSNHRGMIFEASKEVNGGSADDLFYYLTKIH